MHRAYRQGTTKQSSLYEACVPAFSPVLLTLILHIWVTYSACDVLHTNPKLLFYAISVAFSNVLVSLSACTLLSIKILNRTLLKSPFITLQSFGVG